MFKKAIAKHRDRLPWWLHINEVYYQQLRKAKLQLVEARKAALREASGQRVAAADDDTKSDENDVERFEAAAAYVVKVVAEPGASSEALGAAAARCRAEYERLEALGSAYPLRTLIKEIGRAARRSIRKAERDRIRAHGDPGVLEVTRRFVAGCERFGAALLPMLRKLEFDEGQCAAVACCVKVDCMLPMLSRLKAEFDGVEAALPYLLLRLATECEQFRFRFARGSGNADEPVALHDLLGKLECLCI